MPPSSTDGPRLRRAGNPKVKTGCAVCKERRIKCTEERPACANCLKRGRLCHGYPPPPRTSPTYIQRTIAPWPTLAAAPAMVTTTTTTTTTTTPAPTIYCKPVKLPPRRPPKAHTRRLQQAAAAAVAAEAAAGGEGVASGQLVEQQRPMLLYEPATLPLDPQDIQYHQFFQTQILGELTGYFDHHFWSRTVLQECHSSEIIRHAVVALGALYKTLEKSHESPPTSPNNHEQALSRTLQPHWARAVSAYDKAIKAQQRSLSRNSQESSRTLLMATVLLSCFDAFVGDHVGANGQIQAGLRLLQALRKDRRVSIRNRTAEPVEDELIQMFTRLAIQAKSIDMAFHVPNPVLLNPKEDCPGSPSTDGGSSDSYISDSIPECFDSLLTARVAWDRLVEGALRFTERLFTTVKNPNTPIGILPPEMMRYMSDYNDNIATWERAFEPIYQGRLDPVVPPQVKAGVAALKMFQIMCRILGLTTFEATETGFDKFDDDFRQIIMLASEVVGDEEQRAQEKRCPDLRYCVHQHHLAADVIGGLYNHPACHIKPSFSTDLGIVPPLYVVAAKCRDLELRKQAILLLRSSARREGMWDSEVLARIATWIVEIEEGGNHYQPATSSLSPEALSTDGNGLTMYSSNVLSPDMTSQYSQYVPADAPLGPGGNSMSFTCASRVSRPHTMVPDWKRVMIRSATFNLRERNAIVCCGSRNLVPGSFDNRAQSKNFEW